MQTLPQFLDDHQVAGAPIPPKMKALILSLARTCGDIRCEVAASAVNGTQGALDKQNVQGETQKKLDVIANDLMLEETRWSGLVRAVASEEMDHPCHLKSTTGEEPYLLLFDPIDGSSNLDVNGVVGTIFSVLAAPSGEVEERDFLKSGDQQLASGYALYGPQTSFVFTLGAGVHAFSLDPSSQEWTLVDPRLLIPQDTREFAINMSNYRHWDEPVRRYVDECLGGVSGPRGVDFNMRWLAALVGDAHRILARGGVFLYPKDARQGMADGKLRLLYEANPIALLMEQAGGAATDGVRRILSVEPETLHQRVSLVLGSSSEVAWISSQMTRSSHSFK